MAFAFARSTANGGPLPGENGSRGYKDSLWMQKTRSGRDLVRALVAASIFANLRTIFSNERRPWRLRNGPDAVRHPHTLRTMVVLPCAKQVSVSVGGTRRAKAWQCNRVQPEE